MWLTSLPPEYPNASPSFLYGIRYPLPHIQVSDNSWFGFLCGDIWNNWAEDFQMICHCGVCISWTKSLIALYRWLWFSFFSSSFISILPFLHFFTSSCKHVCFTLFLIHFLSMIVDIRYVEWPKAGNPNELRACENVYDLQDLLESIIQRRMTKTQDI